MKEEWKMNNSTTKDPIGCDVMCRSHSARTERDLYRICPSKLSKRELEDLYFALIENNSDLKKTINIQQDKIKVLSTKVQRMTVAQKSIAGKEKDCCASKAVVSEQKEFISDLKKINERMAERIRLLNMRLCSAKQFLKRSPSQVTNTKAIKNSSLSALNAKKSDSNTRTTAVSCQFLDKDVSARTTRTVETSTEKPEKEEPDRLCNENKCRTVMDEMKEKIVNLQEELSTTHDEYSTRITKLELQVSSLQDENMVVVGERAASEHALRQREERVSELAQRLRTKDALCNELNMQLSIEKRKVTELETGLKLANMSSPVAKTIEQLTAMNEKSELDREAAACSYSKKTSELPSYKTQLDVPSSSPKMKEVKSDDSGCTDLNKSSEVDDDSKMFKLNQELLKKIAELQTQLDVLRISAAGEAVARQDQKPKEFESYGVEIKDVDKTQFENTQDSLHTLIVPEKDNLENQQNVAERDKELHATQGVTETEASTSKPWSVYQIDENTTKTNNNQNDMISESSITIKDADNTELFSYDDNRYQIPGPIPVLQLSPSVIKDKRKAHRTNQPARDSNELKNRNTNSEMVSEREKTVKIFDNSKDSYFTSVKDNDSERNGKSQNATLISNGIKKKEYAKDMAHKTKDMTDNKSKYVIITDVNKRLEDFIPTRDSILVHKKKLSRGSSEDVVRSETRVGNMSDVKLDSATSFLLKCDEAVQMDGDSSRLAEQATQVEQNAEMYEMCESRAVICRCPVLAKREVAVFRSCSGTLRFRTTAASDQLRQCGCPTHTNSSGTSMGLPVRTARRDSATYTAPAPADMRERATSPDNTEHEISSLTDLPSEKDAKSAGVLSPGEENATMAYTDTDSTAQTDYGSLSDGELPTGKVRRLSVGERKVKSPMQAPSITSSQKMEATLQTIGEELARCRRLLLSQRPLEDSSQQCPKPSHVQMIEETHALRRSAANNRIADTRAPSCVFTLHIGTLVLSDEALLYTRDKDLVLTWQFYSQAAAMARVQPGRVVIFDFVTEYDITFNDDFLRYMKKTDMFIVLCELGKQEEPFATCFLPLREPLLHTNRRADMSLALVPCLPVGGARDAVGHEIGVLDLWCSLSVEDALLPSIHAAMRTPWPAESRANPLRSEPQVQSAQSIRNPASDEHVMGAFDFVRTDPQPQQTPTAAGGTPFRKFLSDDVESENPFRRYDDEVQQHRLTKPYQRKSSQAQKSIPTSLRLESSGIIASEVPANIKSTEELKHALERNAYLNRATRLHNIDDEESQVHSSIGSVKSLVTRHHLSKLRWPRKRVSREKIDSLQDLLKKDKGSFFRIGGSTSQPPAKMEGYIKDESDMILPKQHNKITNGLNKLGDAAKKSVKYSDSPSPPQKDNSADSDENCTQSIDITILWLALNEECEAMANPSIQRLYIAYSFLRRRGADLETPVSLPKPKNYADKCYFNFKKSFHLHESDLPLLGHMSRCRAGGGASTDPRDCIVFTLVSEPPEDPLGLTSCEDIGYAYLYLGDVLAYSGGSGGYTEVVGVHGVRSGVYGVLAVRVDNLPVLRSALTLSHSL